MSTSLTDPLILIGVAAGTAGVVAFVHARMQSRLLRRRIANGIGTAIIDPATGLFSAAATWQCIRAEANRAWRLDRPLDVWIGTADDAEALEAATRELAFDVPRGATGMRVDRRRVCIVSCAEEASGSQLTDDFNWAHRRIAPGDGAAQHALTFVSEVVGG